MGAPTPSAALVELWIALSLLLLAREACGASRSWTARWPAAVAFPLGLLHGLGFAGALSELGVPADGWWRALLLFNVGVELGQLGVLAVGVASVGLLLRRWPGDSASFR